jgi:hypothetical protein
LSAHISLWLSGESATVALDNLKQRGSELALRRLAVGGVEFRHGDIRNPEPTPEVSTCSLYAQRSPQLKQGCMGENATSSIRTSWARSIASTTPATTMPP